MMLSPEALAVCQHWMRRAKRVKRLYLAQLLANLRPRMSRLEGEEVIDDWVQADMMRSFIQETEGAGIEGGSSEDPGLQSIV